MFPSRRMPRLSEMKPRVHWSTSGESYVIKHETAYSTDRETGSDVDGVVLSDRGQWVHKAVFLPDLEVTVEARNLAIHRPGTYLGPILVGAKKKEAIGVNGGFQLMAVSGGGQVQPALPRKTDQIIQRMQKFSFGYRLQGRTMECLRNEKKVVDSSPLAKFTQGFEAGRVGLHWAGSVQCFIYNVIIKGRLDPDWVAQQLGEKGGKAGKGKKTARS